jgi:hypothetical protein
MSHAWLALALTLVGCTGTTTDEEIRGQVTLMLNQEGAPAQAAADRLTAFGKRAIPTIESALHTASPAGKKSLVTVLGRIGDEAAVPLLGHLAAWEPLEEVRNLAHATLEKWAQQKDARGEKARAALRAVDETRQREEAG